MDSEQALLTLNDLARHEPITKATFAKACDLIAQIEREEPTRLEEAVELFQEASAHWPTTRGYFGLNRSAQETKRAPASWNDRFFKGGSLPAFHIVRELSQPARWKRTTHSIDFIELHASHIAHLQSMVIHHKTSPKSLKPWRADGPWQQWSDLTISVASTGAKELAKSQLDSLEHIDFLVNPNVLPALAKFKNIDQVKSAKFLMCDGASGVHHIDASLQSLGKATWMQGLRALDITFKGSYAQHDAVLGTLSKTWALPDTLESLKMRQIPEQESHIDAMAWLTTLRELRHICLAGSHIQGRHCAAMFEALPKLETLVWDADIDQHMVDAMLGYQGHLKTWTCYGRDLKEKDLSKLIQSPSLSHLEHMHVHMLSKSHVQLIIDGCLPLLHDLSYTFREDGVPELLAAHDRTNTISSS